MSFALPDFRRPFQILWDSFSERLPEVLAAILVFVLFYWLSNRMGALVRRLASRTEARLSLAILLGRVAYFSTLSVGVLLALMFLDPSFGLPSLFSFFGFVSVAFGFAFRDVLGNIVGGLFILWGEPFKIGDSIAAAGFEGIVEGIETRATQLKTADGKRVLIPNGLVYSSALTVNSAFEARRGEAEILVPKDAKTGEIREALLEVLRAEEQVLSDPAPEVLLRIVNNDGQWFVLRFWVERAQNPDLLRVQSAVLLGAMAQLEARGVFPVKLAGENAT